MSSAFESTVASAPSSFARFRFSSLLAVAITRPAPHALASCTAIVPTPPAAAWTTTDSPASRWAFFFSSTQAVVPCTSIESAWRSSTPSGTSNAMCLFATAFSAYPPLLMSATLRWPAAVFPTTSPPGTSGNSLGARYEFSA